MQLLVMVIPTGYSPRYLLPGLLPALLLALIEIRFLLNLKLAGSPRAVIRFASFVLLLVTLFFTRNARTKTVSGFSTAVQRLLQDSVPGQRGVWLVSSDPRGEGAVIAEAAFRTQNRVSGALTVHRGSKSLVDTDWLGKHYQPKFTDALSLRHLLDQLHIDTVLVDLSMDPTTVGRHERALKDALTSADSGWRLDGRQVIERPYGPAGGDLWIFRRLPQ